MERRVGRFPTEQDIIIAKLNLVDLAGVEHLKKTNTDTGGLMRRETCTINKSLSFLEMVNVHKYSITWSVFLTLKTS